VVWAPVRGRSFPLDFMIAPIAPPNTIPVTNIEATIAIQMRRIPWIFALRIRFFALSLLTVLAKIFSSCPESCNTRADESETTYNPSAEARCGFWNTTWRPSADSCLAFFDTICVPSVEICRVFPQESISGIVVGIGNSNIRYRHRNGSMPR